MPAAYILARYLMLTWATTTFITNHIWATGRYVNVQIIRYALVILLTLVSLLEFSTIFWTEADARELLTVTVLCCTLLCIRT